MIFSLCCPLYGLEMVPGKHCPVEEMARSIAESITTTVSICSGDTGYSREMERDVTREEQDQSVAVQDQLQSNMRRPSGWNWYPGQGLRGGGIPVEEEKGNMTKSGSVSRKRQVPVKAETPSKKSKILREYKQVTPKKSPTKTPTKRKTPRLRCKNVLCRVGFATQRAKLFHERFQCCTKEPVKFSPGQEDLKECRFCSQVFTESRSRIRHERNVHHAGSGSNISSQASSVSGRDLLRDESPVSTSSGKLSQPNHNLNLFQPQLELE